MATYGMVQADAPEFSAGKRRTVALRKHNNLHAVLLRVRGTFNVAGGTGVGTIYGDSLYRLVRSIGIKADGNDMVTIPGQSLHSMLSLLVEAEYDQDPPTTLAAGTAEPIELYLYLPFHMLHSFAPDAFALPTAAVDSPTLVVDWGNADDMVTGEDGDVTLSDMEVDLYEIPLQGMTMNPSAYAPIIISYNERPFAQSVKRAKIELPNLQPGMELARVLIEAFAGGAGGADYEYDDNLIETIALNLNGEDLIDQVPFDVLRNRNKVAYQLNARKTGVALIDSAEDKRTERGELYNIVGGLKPYIEVDIAMQPGDCFVRATTIATIR